MVRSKMRPNHPGEILCEEYLVPLGMSVNSLAKALKADGKYENSIGCARSGFLRELRSFLAARSRVIQLTNCDDGVLKNSQKHHFAHL